MEVEYGEVKFSERPRQTFETPTEDCVYAKVRKGRWFSVFSVFIWTVPPKVSVMCDLQIEKNKAHRCHDSFLWDFLYFWYSQDRLTQSVYDDTMSHLCDICMLWKFLIYFFHFQNNGNNNDVVFNCFTLLFIEIWKVNKPVYIYTLSKVVKISYIFINDLNYFTNS